MIMLKVFDLRLELTLVTRKKITYFKPMSIAFTQYFQLF